MLLVMPGMLSTMDRRNTSANPSPLILLAQGRFSAKVSWSRGRLVVGMLRCRIAPSIREEDHERASHASASGGYAFGLVFGFGVCRLGLVSLRACPSDAGAGGAGLLLLPLLKVLKV